MERGLVGLLDAIAKLVGALAELVKALALLIAAMLAAHLIGGAMPHRGNSGVLIRPAIESVAVHATRI